jgi:hypothetical protein
MTVQIDLEPSFVSPERIRSLVATAAGDGCPLVAGTVDPNGQPELGIYGTIQPFRGGSLALWLRRPENFLQRIVANPKTSFIYWNANEHVMLKFYGTAHVLDDVADRDTVFLGSPENERAADPDRNGTAVEVELHLISGFLDGAPYRQD